MNAKDVLSAIRRHYSTAAVVPEVVIEDDYDIWNVPEEIGCYTRRIDALMFKTLERTAIEIKVSKSDAARETWRKVYPWKRVTHRFVYAVPAGLLDAAPFPGCGLWWVHESGLVEVKVRAKVNTTPEPLPQRVIQALAYRAGRAS